MINLFRNVRRKLADDNRPLKYARYAIGEIILVVIGILIALQINNWNEERKRVKQEKNILLALKSDVIESKLRLNQTIMLQKKCIRQSIALISIYEGKIPYPKTDSIKTYLQYGAFSWYRAELVTGAYDALLNAGDSELIKNQNLIRLLAEYFSILNSGFEDQETSMNLLNNMQIVSSSSLLTLSASNWRQRIGLDPVSDASKEEQALKHLFKQEGFFSYLYHKTVIEELRLTVQEDLISRMTEILSIIENELE